MTSYSASVVTVYLSCTLSEIPLVFGPKIAIFFLTRVHLPQYLGVTLLKFYEIFVVGILESPQCCRVASAVLI